MEHDRICMHYGECKSLVVSITVQLCDYRIDLTWIDNMLSMPVSQFWSLKTLKELVYRMTESTCIPTPAEPAYF